MVPHGIWCVYFAYDIVIPPTQILIQQKIYRGVLYVYTRVVIQY